MEVRGIEPLSDPIRKVTYSPEGESLMSDLN